MINSPDGTPLPSPGPKSRKVYILLAVLFGTVGVHNLYAARWREGAIQGVLGVFSLWVGWLGTMHLMKMFQNGLPDASDPDAMEALQQSLIQGASASSWVDTASTVAFLVVAVWVMIDIFRVKTDGAGRAMR